MDDWTSTYGKAFLAAEYDGTPGTADFDWYDPLVDNTLLNSEISAVASNVLPPTSKYYVTTEFTLDGDTHTHGVLCECLHL